MSSPQDGLRERLAEALIRASFSDWDVGEGRCIELPVDVAVDAVMSVIGTERR